MRHALLPLILMLAACAKPAPLEAQDTTRFTVGGDTVSFATDTNGILFSPTDTVQLGPADVVLLDTLWCAAKHCKRVKPAPTLTDVYLSPATAALDTGAAQQFASSARYSNGDSTPVTAAYSATGGTVTSGGLYTAGNAAGTFQVIAAASGKADTSAVTINQPQPPPPPPPPVSAGCPTSGYLRLVNVVTKAQLDAALAASLPGDQIRMAAGTYTYTSNVTVNRSGTVANRSTLCGPRTAIISGGYLAPTNANYWTFRGFRITGNSLWGVYSNPGSFNVYDSLEVDHTGQEAMHFKLTSKHNEIKYTYVHHTGQASAQFGECIYFGSGANGNERADSNWVHHNTLGPCTAEGVDVKEGTTGQLIEFNTITNTGTAKLVGSDVPIALRGDSTQVLDNTISVFPRMGLQIWPDPTLTLGRGNIVRRNHVTITAPAYQGFQIRSGYEPYNKIYCDNTVTGGPFGVTCTP